MLGCKIWSDIPPDAHNIVRTKVNNHFRKVPEWTVRRHNRDPRTRSRVSTWVFGHAHYSADFLVPGTGIRVTSNQRGYVLPGAGDEGDGKRKSEDHVFDAALSVTV